MSTEDLRVLSTYQHCSSLLNNWSGVRCVHSPYPSFTYPCHATIMTGCYPDRTGIFHNTDHHSDAWNWYRSSIKVPTMIDIANEHTISNACICWPVMGGAASDYLIAEIWAKGPEDDPTPIFDLVNSPLAKPIFEKNKHLLSWMKTPGFDRFSLACTTDIIQEAKPRLLFSHLSYLDHQKHQLGTDPTGLHHAYSFIDKCIGSITKATRRAGIWDKTTFILLGDHGQKDIGTIFNLNAELKDRGYFQNSSKWKVFAHYCGCSSHIYTRDIELGEVQEVLASIHEAYPEVIRYIFDKEAFQALHLDGPFDFVVEAQEGFAFGKADSPLFSKSSPSTFSLANHGYLSHTGAEPPFAICNHRGLVIDQASMVDEAPTILKLLGVEAKGMDGAVLPII